ncbi:hypothetical protein C8J95_11022 [Elizabethkingia sp. YR214]|uniref:hypothetical protein n=1 Tax=Elizabethkingia sp. YR214 TaxID=2135667 RepID=UPI000D3164B1|nr:hypothetical protein [Elizabethkingia sp. YR214]PUB26670.1 hypothetical protein C8J95_11022 [Elizabethkingia sp. YR214]
MYKFYKKEGNRYIFKNQPVLMFIGALLFFIIAGMSYNFSAILGLAIAAVAVFIIINFFTKKFIIDMDQLTVTGKHGIFIPEKTYPIADFITFEVIHVKYMGLITINLILAAYFKVDGKEKVLTVGQAVTRRAIQRLLNETEDIMKSKA